MWGIILLVLSIKLGQCLCNCESVCDTDWVSDNVTCVSLCDKQFLARLSISIKKGGLLQLKFGVDGVGVNIYLWAP